MTLYDLIVLAIVLISTFTALMRGVVTELASLVAWVVAFLGAKYFTPYVAPVALSTVEPAALQHTITFILLFFLLLVCQYFLRAFLTQLIKAIGLNGVNKLLGGAFGFALGILIVTIMVVICSLTSLPQKEEWQQSSTIPFFEYFARVGTPFLPKSVSDVMGAYP